MVRPILAYLVTVMLGVWVFYAAEELRRGGDLVRALLLADGAKLPFALANLAFASLLMLPALVLTIELVHRFEANARLVRAVIGAGSWGLWFLFIAFTLAVLSRVVLLPEPLASDLALLLVLGAGFSLVAFEGCEARAGRALAVLALGVTGFVVLGSIVMSGRWGVAT
jgi:hypothetical protein